MGSDNKSDSLPGILILTHGFFGEELIRSAAMIYGDLDGVVAVPLRPDDDPEEYRQRVKEKLDALPEGSLVMVDLLGGTPSNSIMRLVRDSGVCVLSGASMPMLIEAATLRSAHLGRELLELVVEKGHDGIVNITQLLEGA